MSVDAKAEIEIARPRAEVFAFITDVSKDTTWTQGLVSAVQTTEGPFGIGTKIDRESRFLGRHFAYTLDVTDLVDDERVAMTTTSAPFPMTVTYTLEDADGGTRMTIVSTGNPRGFFRLVGSVLNAAVTKAIRADLAALKAALEDG